MLEYKNVSVDLARGLMSMPISLVMRAGMKVCLHGDAGTGKSRLLQATLGLQPIRQGFVTLDGELITPGSAYYFRNMMSYIPQALPQNEMKVSVLLDSVVRMKVNAKAAIDKKAVVSTGMELGISADAWDKATDALSPHALQEMLLVVAIHLHRPVVLIDNLYTSEVACRAVQTLASDGAEVIYTCRADCAPSLEVLCGSDKMIKLENRN